MPASDPTTDVPTPTGTLQGVAVFSWDGAAWQPTGRAGPSVATPTGVLRGVAAFNGGTPWQPVGVAQPGVTTPTGTLDGVAVYTWTGDSWAPPGGTATPSTPHGALRGVAAFNWDGTAWQPASQAGPSVATPYGVLDGVAMFGWSGSAWAATGAPSLSLDFMSPGALDPRITFSRASTATYFNSAGVMQTAAINAPRWDYNPSTLALNGLLIEEARTNVSLWTQDFTNAVYTKGGCAITRPGTGAPDGTSLNLVTEDTSNASHSFYHGGGLTTTAAAWTASVFVRAGTQRYISLRSDLSSLGGTPWITFDTQTQSINANASVTSSGFVALPNGTFRIWLSWPANGGAASIVVAGSNIATAPPTTGGTGNVYTGTSQTWYAWGLQAEAGAFPTSYIPTTAATVTRAQDQCALPVAGWYTAPGGSWLGEYSYYSNPAAGYERVVELQGSGAGPLFVGPGGVVGQYDGVAISNLTVNGTPPNVVGKAASTWAPGLSSVCTNGGAIVTSTTLTGGYTVATGWWILQNPVETDSMSGYIRRVSYWPRVLTNTEMQQVTT